MTDAAPPDILIGPRTTVFALIRAYPSVEPFLRARGRGFEPLSSPRAASRWARVTTLDDVALRRNETWRQLVREIAAEVTRVTGCLVRVDGVRPPVGGDDHRLEELRAIVAGLESGASLVGMAARWRSATGDLDAAEVAALEEALAAGAGGDEPVLVALAAHAQRVPASFPPGHPLDSLRREAIRVRQLCAGLQAELDRLGGSPTRRRWSRDKPLVARLVERLGGVEARFRRLQQAWFPALSVHGISGPQALLAERQADALETLRRLRLAVAGDDAASAAESGARLVELLGDLLAQDERLVEPLARHHLSAGDWAAVRELEDGVAWRLIAPPPRWPPA